MDFKKTVLGGVLLATAVSSSALSIGRVRGAAWVGQPLDVTVPVRLEAGEDGSSLCFDADVFHSDVRIEPRNVRIVTESAPGTAEGREISVRVRSSVVVDEPVVTVYLKVGCDQKVTRRLVLLAELPTETSSAIAAAPLPTLPVPAIVAPAPAPGLPAPPVAAPRPAPAPAPRLADASPPVAPAPRPQRPRPAPAPAAPAAPAASSDQPKVARPAAPAPKAAPAPAPRARLQLDPAEAPPERDGNLRSATQLSGVPEENEQKRAEAAALWRSINAQPEDVLRDSQRMQEMETTLNAIRSQMAQNQANINELKSQLEKAQSERYANNLVYVLVALLLAALAAAAFFWNRGRRGGAARNADWWRDVDMRSPATVQVPPLTQDEGQATVQIHAPMPPPPARPAKTRPPAPAELDLDLGIDVQESGDSVSAPLSRASYAASQLPRRLHTDFHSSFGGSGRSVNTEELFDIHQQVDFFLSLGQHDQAVGVLMGHIRDNPETSALAYLDLFKIYHQQAKRAEYDQLREEFHSVFNADVPEFDAFNEESQGLEGYPETLARIVELWGNPDVVTLVEELIFRRPNAESGDSFDLEAYQELLLLFAVALEVSDDDSAGFVVSGPDSAFAVMSNAALTVPPSLDDEELVRLKSRGVENPREATVSLPPLPEVPPPDQPLGVDIDLVLSDSMVAPLESLPKPRPPAGQPPSNSTDAKSDDNSIDFELFDPSAPSALSPSTADKDKPKG
ncbi:hypothetical protein ACO2Q9_18660 [Variovorax sp. VNK109]|uniref:type IV pilus assembly protein FimV n=1 Tax=Variovorax sp. VNK109 TaxID=3400919 RepID=UPI003C10FC4C